MSAFVIFNYNVIDEYKYAEYAAGALQSLQHFDARIHVATHEYALLEGSAPHNVAVIEFPDMETALDWYHSDDYQALQALWHAATHGAYIMLSEAFAMPLQVG